MALQGMLRTMSITELLTWISTNMKSGALEIERRKICRRIQFSEGRVAASSSDDPPSRFGQFLLSNGKITEEQLREALTRQATGSKNLGTILREMGVLSEAEERRQIAAKAEETVYSLFDWSDAAFRFDEDAHPDPYSIDVDLSVEDIIFKGMQRREELESIRKIFDSSGLVLRRTVKSVPPEIKNSTRAMRILGSIDGERTLAELLLHAHSTEYTAVKFLFTLYRHGIVEITGTKPVDREFLSIIDHDSVDESKVPNGAKEDTDEEFDVETNLDASIESPQAEEPAPDPTTSTLESAIQLMTQGEHLAALDALNEFRRDHPNDQSLQQLILKAESAYLQEMRNRDLRPYRIPIVTTPADLSGLRLDPTELYLLNTIDGGKDIQSILWLTPQRELDVMRTLQQLKDKALILLKDPESSGSDTEELVETGVPEWARSGG